MSHPKDRIVDQAKILLPGQLSPEAKNVITCKACQKKFGFFNKRTHCVVCGDAFCSKCALPSVRCFPFSERLPACFDCRNGKGAKGQEEEKKAEGEEAAAEASGGEDLAVDNQLVLISGVSGYVGNHVTQQMLAAGFRVRGTVRSLADKNEHKLVALRALQEQFPGKLELVEADLTDSASWDQAVKGVNMVAHTASPFPLVAPEDENLLIKPAVEGTLNVLRAIAKYNAMVEAGQKISRVVLTSSVASVSSGFDTDLSKNDYVWSNKNWSNTAKCEAYPKSKTLAEQAAWDFVKDEALVKSGNGFELVAVNPAYVQGPFQALAGGASSQVLLTRMLNNDLPGLARMSLSVVDVRDVARAHVRALLVPGAASKRFIVSAGTVWMAEIAEVLSKEFTAKGYKIPSTKIPKAVMRVVALWDKQVKAVLPGVGKMVRYDARETQRVLGFEFRPLQQTILDTANSLIELGAVKAPAKAKAKM